MLYEESPRTLLEFLHGFHKREKYDLYLSTVTLQEIEYCPEPKRSILYQYMSEIKYTIIDIKQMVSDIAK